MVQVRHALLDAGATRVDLLSLLPLAPLQAVDAEKIAIGSLDYMFFGFVAPELAKLYEIGRIAD
jgi:hypothetical protein